MRTWVEKLAKLSKEKGTHRCIEIKTPNFTWSLHNLIKKELYIKTDKESVFFKIYDDEYDILKEVSDYIKKKTENNLIKLIEEEDENDILKEVSDYIKKKNEDNLIKLTE